MNKVPNYDYEAERRAIQAKIEADSETAASALYNRILADEYKGVKPTWEELQSKTREYFVVIGQAYHQNIVSIYKEIGANKSAKELLEHFYYNYPPKLNKDYILEVCHRAYEVRNKYFGTQECYDLEMEVYSNARQDDDLFWRILEDVEVAFETSKINLYEFEPTDENLDKQVRFMEYACFGIALELWQQEELTDMPKQIEHHQRFQQAYKKEYGDYWYIHDDIDREDFVTDYIRPEMTKKIHKFVRQWHSNDNNFRNPLPF
jgi:hypothetical protein